MLSEYYRVTGEQEALELAKSFYRCIEEYSFDGMHNGYSEACGRDWSPIGDVRLSDKDQNDSKTMNTHLHILEGYTNLYRVWKDEGLKDRLKNLIVIFTRRIMQDDGHLGLFFGDDWEPHSTMVSYGHDIEASWLLREAAEVLGDPLVMEEVNSASSKIAEARAVDAVRDRFGLTGDGIWLERAGMEWKFIRENLISPDGEWYWSVREDGSLNLADDRAGFWKCPYHNGRMCLEMLARL